MTRTAASWTPSVAAMVFLNDTFPNPLAVLGALVMLVLPVIVFSWTAARLIRRRPIPWPSPILALGLFVVMFLLAIAADLRFPRIHPLESLVGAIATVVLFPGLMLAGPLGLLDSPHPTAGQSANQHFVLAIGGTAFWYLMLLGWNLWMLRASEPTPGPERSSS